MVEERSVVGHVDAEKRHVEIIAVIVEESHKESGWCESGAHLQVPFVHVCHEE